ELMEISDELMIERVGFLVDGLQTTRAVHVTDRRNLGAFFGAELEDWHHERDIVVSLEPLGDVLTQNGRRERTEGFAAFDLGVEDVLHVRSARVTKNRAVAQRAGTPFHPSLKP